MKIYYTNKVIFWSNEGKDFLEKNRFNEYLNDWKQIANVKSVNWDTHYTANFFATNNFEATYFKIEKDNFTYYFFIENIQFDSAKGRQFFLTLDFYNTYTINFIERLKLENPLVIFKRKHAERWSGIQTVYVKNQHNYLLNIPDYLNNYSNYVIPAARLRYVDPALQASWKNVIPSSSYSEKISADSAKCLDLSGTKYRYLKIKPPSNSKRPLTINKDIQMVYVPVTKNKYLNDTLSNNDAITVKEIPADYVVGMISSYVAPNQFEHYGVLKELYKNPTAATPFDNIESIGLIAITDSTGLHKFNYKFIEQFGDAYNIDNYKNEIMLYLEPFTYYSVNDNLKFSINYLLDGFLSTINQEYSFTTILSTDLITRLKYTGLMDNVFKPSLYASLVAEEPFSSDVYNNYLLNNINSINTGIRQTSEKTEFNAKWSSINGALSAATGLASAVIGAGMGSASALTGGISNMISGVGSAIQGGLAAKMDLKHYIGKVDATKADVANKPDKMLDTYGEGVAQRFTENFQMTTYTLPDNYKKMVFADIYFHGYIVNSVYAFNTYDNRINFNYFELANSYNLVSQYLKYPKKILSDIADQVDKGIRLWKTPNFDYTMKLDNREIR